MRNKPKKLNIAAGRRVLSGFDNLDLHNKFGSNVIWDLEEIPLPFENETYDFIKADFILEHFNDCLPHLTEWIRILKRGGLLEVLVPYGDLGFDSIDHRRIFFITTFLDFLIAGDFDRPGLEDIDLAEIKFITRQTKIWPRFKVFLFNKLIKIHIKAIDYTFLRFFCKGVMIKAVYTKKDGRRTKQGI